MASTSSTAAAAMSSTDAVAVAAAPPYETRWISIHPTVPELEVTLLIEKTREQKAEDWLAYYKSGKEWVEKIRGLYYDNGTEKVLIALVPDAGVDYKNGPDWNYRDTDPKMKDLARTPIRLFQFCIGNHVLFVHVGSNGTPFMPEALLRLLRDDRTVLAVVDDELYTKYELPIRMESTKGQYLVDFIDGRKNRKPFCIADLSELYKDIDYDHCHLNPYVAVLELAVWVLADGEPFLDFPFYGREVWSELTGNPKKDGTYDCNMMWWKDEERLELSEEKIKSGVLLAHLVYAMGVKLNATQHGRICAKRLRIYQEYKRVKEAAGRG